MDSHSQSQIPVIDLSKISLNSDRGTQEWNRLCIKIREACENFGCFELVYDKIPTKLRSDAFAMARQVFELPVEVKKKNTNPKPMHGYLGGIPTIPLHECLSIENATNYDSLASFVQLLWPDGHHQFCEIISLMLNPMEELKKMVQMMILDSYGLGDKFALTMENMSFLKMNEYKAPPPGESMDGLLVHTDKGYFVLLFDDQLSGLQVQTKDGNWIQLFPSSSSFVFMVGDSLMAWSNGRMHSPKHRVIMEGEKDRYSLGVFAMPTDGKIIEPVKELVDEDHPQLFNKYHYADLINFCFSQEGYAIESAKQLFAYAGTS